MTDFHTRPFFSEATRDCFGCQMGQAWKRQDFLFQPERSQALLCTHAKTTITFLLSIQSILLHLKKLMNCKMSLDARIKGELLQTARIHMWAQSQVMEKATPEFGTCKNLGEQIPFLQSSSDLFCYRCFQRGWYKQPDYSQRYASCCPANVRLDFRNSSLQSLFLQHFFSYHGMRKMKPALKLSASASPNWLLQQILSRGCMAPTRRP